MASENTPKLTLYYGSGACSLAPHILLREAGLDFDALSASEPGNYRKFIKDFHLINDKMKVPVLVLDGTVITEVPAIATAISNLAPNLHLMGSNPIDTAKVYEWMNWLSGTVHGQGFGAVFRPERYSVDPNAQDGIKAKGKEFVGECFDRIESKLTGLHAVGDALTAVDPYLLVFFRWGNGNGFEMKKYPKYTALVKNLVERPAVKATLEAEGIESTL